MFRAAVPSNTSRVESLSDNVREMQRGERSGLTTWFSGGIKIFPREERNSRAASSSSGSAHCWDSRVSTHDRAWETHPQWMQVFEARWFSWKRNASCVPEKSLAAPYLLRKPQITTGAAARCGAAHGGSSPGGGGGEKVTFAQHRGAFVVIIIDSHLVWTHSWPELRDCLHCSRRTRFLRRRLTSNHRQEGQQRLVLDRGSNFPRVCSSRQLSCQRI